MSSHPYCLFLTILIPLFIISSSSSSSVDHVDITNDEDGGIAVLPSELVDSICKQTSNYTFCVESIYTDPRALKAHDYFLLAYISFGLAYLNATDTLSYIKNYYLSAAAAAAPTTTATVYNTNSSSSPDEKEDGISSSSTLQRCREDYERAVSALEEAYNDLNSETYFDLKVLANSASHDALHCSSQLQHINFKEGKGKGKGKGKGRRRRRSGHSSNSGNIILLINSILRKRNADLRDLCEICVVVSNQFS